MSHVSEQRTCLRKNLKVHMYIELHSAQLIQICTYVSSCEDSFLRDDLPFSNMYKHELFTYSSMYQREMLIGSSGLIPSTPFFLECTCSVLGRQWKNTHSHIGNPRLSLGSSLGPSLGPDKKGYAFRDYAGG